MRIPNSVVRALKTTLALTLLAGCSAGGNEIALRASNSTKIQPTWSRHLGNIRGSSHATPFERFQISKGRTDSSFVHPFAKTAPLVYVSDFTNNEVDGFTSGGRLTIRITGLTHPQGLFVDRSENLWVANTDASNIQVFSKGSVRPIATYYEPNEFPADVTVCPDGGIYASNITDGSISVYSAGKPNPIRTLSDPNSTNNFFITCDAHGNVFVTFERRGPAAVDEYVGGVQSGLITLPINLGYPGGIKPDDAGNLLVNDQKAQTVAEYTEGGALTGRAIATGSGDIVDIAVTRNGLVVGGADAVKLTGQSWYFPSGTPRHTYTDSFTTPVGFAYDPGQKGI